MDILANLNPAQREAVQAIEGPVLVLAGPGSGKTRVLIHRVAYLIQVCGIPPYNIMAVTFTNKAAREMKERLHHLIGRQLRGLTIGTFHATCARILRREARHLGLERSFLIYDDGDQLSLIKQAVKELDLDDKMYRPTALQGAIRRAKQELIGPDAYAPQTYWHEVARRVYARYQELLRANNALDFDDLLMATAQLFREHPEVLERYQRRYLHILVDEFQDTNMAQYELLKLLAGKHRNLFVVGDEDQCVAAGTPISTPSGSVPVEHLRIGAPLRVAAGRGEAMTRPAQRIHQRPYRGPVIEIETERGHRLTVTPNHMMFARLGLRADIWYVYLMYRYDKGYRIGLVQGTRHDAPGRKAYTGLLVRGNQEKADKLWLLRVCETKAEALYWEQYYAFQYGIPTTVFHTAGRRMTITQEIVDALYERIDTTARAEKLMEDLYLSAAHPHHRPKGIAGNRLPTRVTVQLRMFGDTRRSTRSPWNAHRVDINTSDEALREEMERRGYRPRPGRRGTWRVGWSNLDYGQALRLAHEVAAAGGGLEVAQAAFVTASTSPGGLALKFDVQPASHLHPTMIVPVEEEGRIVEDVITRVTWQDYQGEVYDLDVDKVHNYVAGGIVVHNSIYAWRGADFRNIQRFRRDFPEARVILLEQNYRSTQTILDAARNVIALNTRRTEKRLWTDKKGGVPLTLFEAYNEQEEAEFVVSEIQRLVARDGYRPGDCAVMYRTNAQSRALEDAFVRRGVPYKLVGATRFYERREIKDILAYLRLIHNPYDQISLERIINVPPRGIGRVTLAQLERWAERLNVPIYAALQLLKEKRETRERMGERDPSIPFDTRTEKVLLRFLALLDDLIVARQEKGVPELLDLVLERTGYADYIRDGTEEGEDRWSNLLELRGVAQEYAGLSPEMGLTTFLEEVALVSDVDNLDERVDAPTLLTLHSAKGLEFPVVFIVGLEEGLLPHSRSMDNPDQMEEERRLCYVGLTRAKERLYLVYTFRRTFRGLSAISEPSRFLGDIPPHLIRGWNGTAIGGTEMRELMGTEGTEGTGLVGSFKAGDKVRHPTFGEGVVVSARVTEADEEVDVAFVGHGVKKLLASFARLEKL